MSKKIPNPECCPFLEESPGEFASNTRKCWVTEQKPTTITLLDGYDGVEPCRRKVVKFFEESKRWKTEVFDVDFVQCPDYSRAVYGLTRERIRAAIEKQEPIHEIVQATLAKELLRLINRVVGGEEK